MTQIVYSNSDPFIFLLHFSISMYRRVKTNLHLEGLHLINSKRNRTSADADRLKELGFLYFSLEYLFRSMSKNKDESTLGNVASIHLYN